MTSTSTSRCPWCLHDPLDIHYHDSEWGVPVHDDRLLFEMLNLEGAQAGLSWFTILQKRARYKEVFANFNAEQVAAFSNEQLEIILQDKGIVRNRLKVYGVRKNAIAFLAVQQDYDSFDQYIWSYVDHTPIIHHWQDMSEVPVDSDISKRMSKDLKKRGFTFVGPTICYAYMQAIRMVNDHLTSCYRHQELQP